MIESGKIFSKRCWVDGKLQPATITYEHGIITDVADHQLPGSVNLGDDVIMPGIIDAHVHINEPGRTEWEGFDTATQAAAAGGITSLIDMPLNASPVTVNLEALQTKLAASKDKLHVNVGFYGGLIPGHVKDIQAMIDAGISGVKCFLVHSGIDEFPNVSESDINEAMPVLAKNNIPLLVHAELDHVPAVSGLQDHPSSYSEYLNSRPDQWETDAIRMLIGLCRKHHCPVHIVHVSSAQSLAIIEDAKKEGLPVTAETCPHYIYFHAEDIPDGQPLYKCAPPIRGLDNNRLLKEGLVSGVLDFLATDHSPAPPDIKELESGNLLKAWGGIAGLQLLLPVSWSALKETMALEQFIPLLTEKPAHFLQADTHKGYLKTGYDADLVVWSPERQFRVSENDILHRHKGSPYEGLWLQGEVKQTIVNGILVFHNHQIKNKLAGKWLLKK